MAYGEIKVDTITFTDGGIDKSVTISGLVQNPTFSGNITVTGTISGNTVRGQTVSGVTVTGTTAQFTSGTFTTIAGGVATIASGVFASGNAAGPSVSVGTTTNGIYSPATNQIAIATSGTGRLFVDASGRVIVGAATAAIGSPFEIVGNTNGQGIGVRGRSSDNIGLISFHPNASATEYARIQSNGDSSLSFGTGSSGTERARIDSSGRLLVGTSSSLSVNSITAGVQLHSIATNNGASISVARFVNDAFGPQLILGKSRNSTVLAGTIVQNGDELGQLVFNGDDNTDLNTLAARIAAFVDGTPGDNSMPGRLVFSTATNTSPSVVTERMRIDSSGRVGIGTSAPSVLLHSVVSSAGVAYRGGNNNTGFDVYVDDSTGEARLVAKRTGGSGGKFMSFYTDTGSGEFERARIDSSGRLLVGTSTSISVGAASDIQLVGSLGYQSQSRWVAAASGPGFVLGKSRSATPGSYTIVQNGDDLGSIFFAGDDGTDLVSTGARISCQVDGTPGTNDMPGRIVLSTTADGTSSPTERMRITNDGVVCYDQAAPVSYAAAATLIVGDLKNGLIQYTGAAATLTLPTGTLTEGGFAANSLYNNITFEWSVINTGSGTCTIGSPGASHTIVGGATIAAGASGRFASRRTAANTFISYRLS